MLEIYRENRDGAFPTFISQTNAFGVESGEVAQVHVLTNNIHYTRVTQSVTNAPLNQVYSLNISEQNSPIDLDFIRAVNWLTFTNMPSGTTLLMDSNVIYTFNQSIQWATNLPPGVHQFEVQAPTGYESYEDSDMSGQVQNMYNLVIGNPRLINIVSNQTTFLDFYFEPYFTFTGRLVDAWVGTPCQNVGLPWQAISGHTQFMAHPMTRHPYHATWANPWFTDLDGGFPSNTSLLTLNYDLPLNVSGYEPFVFTNILMNPIPRSLVDVGTLTLHPLDLNGNNIADSWENIYFWNVSNFNPTADTDGDGSSHWEEYIAGTDPLVSTSVCAFKTISSSNGNVSMAWDTAPGRVYRIRCGDRLTMPLVWQASGLWPHSVGPWTGTVNTTEMGRIPTRFLLTKTIGSRLRFRNDNHLEERGRFFIATKIGDPPWWNTRIHEKDEHI
ncbi:MAG: hypothetical protein GKR87_09730 [Kiritimatiellae bacterium]|nr:hypothetical protein [Kiritimatiellia bacterium]